MPKSLRGLALSLSNGFTLIRTLLRKNLVNVKAFTLIELLVVISIIAILSAVGLVTYNGIRTRAQDAKIKSDLNAIKKAYESNYDPTANGGQGGYKSLSTDGINSTYFADGKLPKQPGGTSYSFAYGPDAAVPNNKTDGYKVSSSTSLSDGSTPTVVSNQGTVPASQLNSCDPGNTLASLSNDLVGYWKFNDQPQASILSDSSSSSITGIWGGIGSHWTTGQAGFGNAGNFNGIDDYVDGGTSTSLTFSDNFTISTWVFPTAYHTTGFFGLLNGFIARGPASTYNYALETKDPTTITFVKRTAPEGLKFYDFTGVPFMTNKWTHVAITISGGTATLYINGSLFRSMAVGTIAGVEGDHLYIGNATKDKSETAFTGKIDDVRIYNRPLIPTEITNLFNMQTTQCVLP